MVFVCQLRLQQLRNYGNIIDPILQFILNKWIVIIFNFKVIVCDFLFVTSLELSQRIHMLIYSEFLFSMCVALFEYCIIRAHI